MFNTATQTPAKSTNAAFVAKAPAKPAPVNSVDFNSVTLMPIEAPAPARRGILEQRRRRARRLAARH